MSQVHRRLTWKAALDAVVAIALLAAASTVVWRNLHAGRPSTNDQTPAVPVPKDLVELGDGPTLGSPASQVVLLEFSDFQCPFCAKFSIEILPEIRAKYVDSGLVQFAFRNLPLPAIHKSAQRAAEAAACANEQGLFWKMHDALFAQQGILEDSNLITGAAAVGLRMPEFRSCLGSAKTLNRMTDAVDKDALQAKRLGIRGTPAFLVGIRTASGGLRIKSTIAGARKVETFAEALDTALKMAKSVGNQ